VLALAIPRRRRPAEAPAAEQPELVVQPEAA
jgi:hypothetical protein